MGPKIVYVHNKMPSLNLTEVIMESQSNKLPTTNSSCKASLPDALQQHKLLYGFKNRASLRNQLQNSTFPRANCSLFIL